MPPDPFPSHEGQWPKRIYVCNGCGFTALEPVKHMYEYPRIPVPGYHQHTAAMMLPVEVVPVQQQPNPADQLHDELFDAAEQQPERGAEDQLNTLRSLTNRHTIEQALDRVAEVFTERQERGAEDTEAVALLRELAPEEPMNQDEQGGCVWCAGTPPRQTYGYATADPKDHLPGCPWIAARAFLARLDTKGERDDEG